MKMTGFLVKMGLVLVVMVSCVADTTDIANADAGKEKKPYFPQTQTAAEFQGMLKRSTSSLESMVGKALEYPPSDALRDLVASGEVMDVNDFSLYFDPLARRTVTLEDGSTVEITLGEEMLQIGQDFLAELEQRRPAIPTIEALEGTIVADNLVYLADGMIMDMNSISGIIALELLEKQLNGASEEELDAILADMNGVSGDYPDEEAAPVSASRSIYKLATPKHKGGKIYYSWGDIFGGYIKDEHKAELRESMRDWESKVSNIKFIDKTNDTAHQALSFIWLTTLRCMITANLPGDTQGMAIWGAPAGRTHLTLDKGLPAGDKLARTARHELGHVLGLEHEHQRWDRDNYITVPPPGSGIINKLEYGFNSAKIKEYLIVMPVYWIFFKTSVIKIKTWFGTIKISILVPYFKQVSELKLGQLAAASPSFDWHSIMLYGNLEAKTRDANLVDFRSNNVPITRSGSQITTNDAKAVKEIYAKVGWF